MTASVRLVSNLLKEPCCNSDSHPKLRPHIIGQHAVERGHVVAVVDIAHD